MTTSRAVHAASTVCVTVAQIEHALAIEHQDAFRRFTDTLPPPLDAPGCKLILEHAIAMVAAYQASLGSRAAEHLQQDVTDELKKLSTGLASVTLVPVAANSLMRRLSRSPAWALLLAVTPEALPANVRIGLGAALATAWHEGHQFSPSLATHVRRELETGRPIDGNSRSIGFKKLTKAKSTADALFKTTTAEQTHSSTEDYAGKLRSWARQMAQLASDRKQQGVYHNRTQTEAQFKASALALRSRVEAGDNLALHMLIGSLGHLRDDLVGGLAILGPHTNEPCLLAVDPQTGCLHCDLDLFSKGGATPPTEAAPDTVDIACRTLVKPLPAFAADRVAQLSCDNPTAQTLDELAPVTEPLRAHSRTLAQDAKLAPTYAKFRNTLGPFAITHAHVDRYLASQVTHTLGLVPGGKHYYARATREEIWLACETIFQAMGWGPPAPMVDGMGSGSQVVPTTNTLVAWSAWLSEQIEGTRTRANCSKKDLLSFYSIYSKTVASQLAFLLALRHRRPLRITAQMAAAAAASIRIADKRTGAIPGPHAVPLPTLAQNIIREYLRHLGAVDARLVKLGVPDDDPIRIGLKRILAGDPVPLFTEIRRGRHCAVSSQDLQTWWPIRFGLLGNSGRHYLQNALRALRVRSTDIDLYVRHVSRGMAPTSSVSTQSRTAALNRLFPALEAIAASIEMKLLSGYRGGKKAPC